jgi:hypothetical protein
MVMLYLLMSAYLKCCCQTLPGQTAAATRWGCPTLQVESQKIHCLRGTMYPRKLKAVVAAPRGWQCALQGTGHDLKGG